MGGSKDGGVMMVMANKVVGPMQSCGSKTISRAALVVGPMGAHTFRLGRGARMSCALRRAREI